MGEIRYIIIAKQFEVARKSCIDDFPCNLTQFCYIILYFVVIAFTSSCYPHTANLSTKVTPDSLTGNPKASNAIVYKLHVKWVFHRPTNHADERHKTADEWNFQTIFGRCNRFAKSADQLLIFPLYCSHRPATERLVKIDIFGWSEHLYG